MKCLRFELFTPTGIFKTPFSVKGIETYPLPPYSTIIGLLYTALGRKWQGETFRLSVQGSYESIFRDYVRFRKYHPSKGGSLPVIPIEVPVLYNLSLTVHLSGEYSLLIEFEKALKNPSIYIYLSGGEYPVKVEGVGFVELEEKSVGYYELSRSAFVPAEVYERLIVSPSGTLYLLPAFLKKDSKNREHQWVEAYYLQRGAVIRRSNILIEKERGLPVWL